MSSINLHPKPTLFKVFRVADIGGQRDHHKIFVETENDGSGFIFQVAGDIQNGMTFESKIGERPEDSLSFSGKKYLGSVSAVDYPRVGAICNLNPPPKKQFDGPKKMFPA